MAATGPLSRLIARAMPAGGRLAPLLYAAIGGLAAGLGTAALVKLLDVSGQHAFEPLADALPFGRWSVVPVVAFGGLLAGAVARSIGRESRGHGVPDVMYAFEYGSGRLPWRVTVSGALATAATIASGGSAGQEGPSVHIGAGLASLAGGALRVGQEHRRVLVAVGAAGGISAVFNAPLTGSFFALEVVLRRFSVRNFSSVVLGSVLANVVYRGLMGNEQVLRSPAYSLDSGWEVPPYALLALATGICAVLFVRGLGLVERLRGRAHIGVAAPAVGGALVGIIGVWHGQVLGTGTAEIARYLQGNDGARLLLALTALKLAATSLTLGSGGTGGVFMPSLFLGASLGGAFGVAANHVTPGVAAPAGAYAVAGMAGVFAAAASAPITGLLLAFEVSSDYGLVIPLMVVVVISTATAQLLMHETIYSEGLRRIGIDITRERLADPLAGIPVESAAKAPAATVSAGTPVSEVRALFARTGVDILPVVEDGRLMGMLSSRDLLVSLESPANGEGATAGDVMARPPVVTRPGESLQQAALRMDRAEVRALGVVDGEGRLLGVLGRAQIVAAYARARGEAEPAAAGPEPLLNEVRPAGVRMIRLRVSEDGPFARKTLRELNLPDGSLVISVRRDRSTLVPRGALVLYPGDRLVILAEEHTLRALRRMGIGGDVRPAGPAERLRGWLRRR